MGQFRTLVCKLKDWNPEKMISFVFVGLIERVGSYKIPPPFSRGTSLQVKLLRWRRYGALGGGHLEWQCTLIACQLRCSVITWIPTKRIVVSSFMTFCCGWLVGWVGWVGWLGWVGWVGWVGWLVCLFVGWLVGWLWVDWVWMILEFGMMYHDLSKICTIWMGRNDLDVAAI